jgi:putative spermidine/putrescine transport system permease protein
LHKSASRFGYAEVNKVDQQPRQLLFFMPMLIVLGLYGSAFAAFIGMSFYRSSDSGAIDTSAVGWYNYERFFSSSAAISNVYDTLFISALLTVLTLLLAYPFAYMLSRIQSSVMRRCMLGIVMVTFLSGGITRAYAWMIVLGNNGLINRLVVALGLDRLPLLYNLTGVAIALVHFLLPFCILTLVGTFQTIPRTMEEAGTSLGASRAMTFWKIVFPLSARGIVGAGVLTFSVAISSFLFPLLLGGGRVRMMSNQIYDLIFTSFDIPFGAATAVIFLLVVVASITTVTFILGLVFDDRRWNPSR